MQNEEILFASQRRSANYYADKNGRAQARNDKGQYGYHRYSKARSAYEDVKDKAKQTLRLDPFYQRTTPLQAGDYRLGEANIAVRHNGLAANAMVGGFSFWKTRVNKNLIELKADPNYLLLGGVITAFQTTGLPVEKLRLVEYAWETPSISAGFNFSSDLKGIIENNGVDANLRLIAIRFLIDTPYGEMTARLKYDIGASKSYKLKFSQSTIKIGTNIEDKIGIAMVELSMPPETSNRIREAADTKIGKLSQEALHFLERMGARPSDNTEAGFYQIPQDKQQQTVDALLDEMVERTTAPFGDDETIQSLKKEYQGNNHESNNNKYKKYETFQKKFIEQIRDEIRYQQFMGVWETGSLFLGQVAQLTGNKGLGQVANGLNAMHQAAVGFEQVTSAISTFGSAGFLASAPSFFSGAGLVLGAVSMMSELMNAGNDDGGYALGEAIIAMHQSILDMHKEQRESFAITWQKLDEIEKNNWQRFKLTMDMIDYVYTDLRSILLNVDQQIHELKEFIKTRLDQIENQDMRVAMEELKLVDKHNWKERLPNSASIFYNWLSVTAKTEGKLGSVVDSIENLHQFINHRQQKPISIPFGMLLKLLQRRNQSGDNSKSYLSAGLFNPQDYFNVLYAYCTLLKVTAPAIHRMRPETKNGYLEQVKAIRQSIIDVKTFLEEVAGSENIWQDLIDEYQSHFSMLKQTIANASLPEPSDLEFTLPENARFKLLNSAMSHFNQISNPKLLKKINKEYPWKWNDVVGKLSAININVQPNYHLRAENLLSMPGIGVKLSKMNAVQQAVLLESESIATTWDTIENELSGSFVFAFGRMYGYTEPTLLIHPVKISNPISMHALFFLPSVRISKQDYPFAQGPLFSKTTYGNGDYENNFHLYAHTNPKYIATAKNPLAQLELLADHPNGHDKHALKEQNLKRNIFDVLSQSRHEFQTTAAKNSLIALFDDALIAARKKLFSPTIASYNAETGQTVFDPQRLTDYLANLEKSYLSLIAFIKLFDPDFKHVEKPAVIEQIKIHIENAAHSGSAEDLSALYGVLSGKPLTIGQSTIHADVWQEEIWPSLAPNSTVLNALTLKQHAITKLANNDLMKLLNKALSDIADVQNTILGTTGTVNPEHRRKSLTHQLNHIANEQQANLAQTLKMIEDTLSVLELVASKVQHVHALNKLYDELHVMQTHYEKIAVSTQRKNSKPTEQTTREKAPRIKISDNASILIKLCANPTVSLSAVKAELESLEEEGIAVLSTSLATKDTVSHQRPLELAIQTARADLVELLLQRGAVPNVDSTTAAQMIPDEAIRSSIQSIIDFYQYMKTEIKDPEVEITRTLGMISESMAQLFAREQIKLGDITLGDTGDGKSSLINCAAGVNYEVVTPNAYEASYLKVIGDKKEVTDTGHSSRSQTSLVQIVKAGQQYFIDMPGFGDSRGISQDIVTGISMQLLASRVKQLRSITLVVDASKLMKGRFAQVKNALDMLAKVIDRNPTLAANVILVVNRAPGNDTAIVIKRLKQLRKDNQATLSAETLFLLEYLIAHPEQTMPIVFPSPDFGKVYRNYLSTLTAQDTQAFHFNRACRETERFKQVVEKLLHYRRHTCDNAELLSRLIIDELKMSLEKFILGEQQFFVDVTTGDFANEYVSLPDKTLVKAKATLRAQHHLKANLQALYGSLSQYLRLYLNNAQQVEKITATQNPIADLIQNKANANTASQYLDAMAPVLRSMALDDAAGYNGCIDIPAEPIDDTNQYSSDTRTSGECHGQICDSNIDYVTEETTMDDTTLASSSGPSLFANAFPLGEVQYQSSVNEQLPLLQWGLYYVSQWLPWNQAATLTRLQRNDLKNLKITLPHLLQQAENFSAGIIGQTLLFQDKLSWLQFKIRSLQNILRDTLQQNKASSAQLNEIITTKDHIIKELDNLTQKEHKLTNWLGEAEMLRKQNKRLKISYDPVLNILSKRVIDQFDVDRASIDTSSDPYDNNLDNTGSRFSFAKTQQLWQLASVSNQPHQQTQRPNQAMSLRLNV